MLTHLVLNDIVKHYPCIFKDIILMKKNAIQQLERQIDELLHIGRLMYKENILLKTQQTSWLTERAKLITKTDLVRSRMKTMLVRLKQLDNE